MPRIYNIRAKTGTYKDDTGAERDRWQQIGVVLETNGKMYVKIDVIPIGWDGFGSLLAPNDQDGESRPARGRAPRGNSPAPAKTGPAAGDDGFDDPDAPF